MSETLINHNNSIVNFMVNKDECNIVHTNDADGFYFNSRMSASA